MPIVYTNLSYKYVHDCLNEPVNITFIYIYQWFNLLDVMTIHVDCQTYSFIISQGMELTVLNLHLFDGSLKATRLVRSSHMVWVNCFEGRFGA